MKRTLVCALLVIGVAAAVTAVAAGKGVVMSASDMKWMDNAALKGAKQTVLWGEPAKGPYGAIKSIPGGTAMGPHTHSADEKAVVVSGTLEFNFEGEAKKELGAGSYVSIPANAVHDVTCKAGADCVYFEEAAGPADYKRVDKK